MPFLQVLWNPERISEDRIVRVRDQVAAEVGPALMAVDPAHIVSDAMVDVRLVAQHPLDRIRSTVFVTLFARHEPPRSEGAAAVVEHLRRAAVEASGEPTAIVELVLTDHHSSFDYAGLE